MSPSPSRQHDSPELAAPTLEAGRVARSWWPLAASWMLMGAELPLFTATVARMPDAERNLAAYGSLVFPIALAIESPIIMLLAASTALCSDWAHYLKLRRFMFAMAASLTALHVAVAFTPLFDLVALRVIGAPAEVLEPARIGLRIMTPWTAAIAYRRFQQGVMIRFDRSRAVGAGTLVRLCANVLVLGLGLASGRISGIVVGACAVAFGVVSEAVFAHLCVQSIVRERLRPAPVTADPLTRDAFLRFYAPLALTPLVTLLAQPIGAMAMSHMDDALAALATWPALHGLVFLVRSLGLAYNEVVVALIGEPGAAPALKRFTLVLAAATTALLATISFTPVSQSWFAGWCHLPPHLAQIGASALAFALALPALNVVQSFFQGGLVQRRQTRGVTEAVVVSLLVTSAGLAACVRFTAWPALSVAAAMLTLGNVAQTLWLWGRWRASVRATAPTRSAKAG